MAVSSCMELSSRECSLQCCSGSDWHASSCFVEAKQRPPLHDVMLQPAQAMVTFCSGTLVRHFIAKSDQPLPCWLLQTLADWTWSCADKHGQQVHTTCHYIMSIPGPDLQPLLPSRPVPNHCASAPLLLAFKLELHARGGT